MYISFGSLEYYFVCAGLPLSAIIEQLSNRNSEITHDHGLHQQNTCPNRFHPFFQHFVTVARD
jgi:hypothetical protein